MFISWQDSSFGALFTHPHKQRIAETIFTSKSWVEGAHRWISIAHWFPVFPVKHPGTCQRLNGFSVRGPRPGVRCRSVFMWKHTCACATMRIKALLTLQLNTHWVKLGSRAAWISKFIQSARLGVSCGHEIAEDPIPRLTAKSAST